MTLINASLVVIGLSLVGVLDDYFIKLAGHDGSKYIDFKLFIIGFLVYSSTAIGWFFVMKYIKLSTLGVIYGVTTVVALTTIGVFVFKEHLSIYEIIGVLAGVSSTVLLF